MLHVGMDMHKKFSVVTVMDDAGNELLSGKRLENDESEIREFFGQLESDIDVVLEAGPSWYWMCDLLDTLEIDNKLCHPLKVKAIASARIKTDKIDSRILAHLSRMDFIPEAHKPSVANRHLRELLRHRASLVRTRASLKNRVHAMLAKLNVTNSYSDLFGKAGTAFLESLQLAPVYRDALNGYLDLIAAINDVIRGCDERAAAAFDQSPDAQLLATIPGVGKILALTIAAEIDDIDRFGSAKQLSSFAGLVPSTSQSGGFVRHGKITKQGSAWLRWALVEAVMHSVKYPGHLRDCYLGLKRRKGTGIARVASARKLSTYVYHMLKESKEYSTVLSYQKGDLG